MQQYGIVPLVLGSQLEMKARSIRAEVVLFEAGSLWRARIGVDGGAKLSSVDD